MFFPKVETYYWIEKKLYEKKRIVINNEVAKDGLVACLVKDLNVNLDDLPLFHVDKITIWPLLLFNAVEIKNIKSKTKMFPGTIYELSFIYSILKPWKIDVHGEGDYGVIKGYINTKKVYLTLLTKNGKTLPRGFMKYLKQSNKSQGVYIYEYDF